MVSAEPAWAYEECCRHAEAFEHGCDGRHGVVPSVIEGQHRRAGRWRLGIYELFGRHDRVAPAKEICQLRLEQAWVDEQAMRVGVVTRPCRPVVREDDSRAKELVVSATS